MNYHVDNCLLYFTDDDTDDDDDDTDKPFSFLYGPLYYNKVLHEDTVKEILNRFKILEEFTKVNITTEIIDHLNKHH